MPQRKFENAFSEFENAFSEFENAFSEFENVVSEFENARCRLARFLFYAQERVFSSLCCYCCSLASIRVGSYSTFVTAQRTYVCFQLIESLLQSRFEIADSIEYHITRSGQNVTNSSLPFAVCGCALFTFRLPNHALTVHLLAVDYPTCLKTCWPGPLLLLSPTGLPTHPNHLTASTFRVETASQPAHQAAASLLANRQGS